MKEYDEQENVIQGTPEEIEVSEEAGAENDEAAVSEANVDESVSNETPNLNPSKSKRKKAITVTKKLALTAVLSGLAFGLYMLGPLYKLPFIFPSFLDLQFSELPALIGGYALGPAYGALIILIKCAIKMPMTSTAFTGEICDAILGLAFVLPSTIFYRFNKTKKGALISLIIGSAICVATAILLNRFVIVPTYVKLFFKGQWEPLVGALKSLFPNITKETFYNYYLWASVLPFNVLRCFLTSTVTFFVYKRVSKLFKKFTG